MSDKFQFIDLNHHRFVQKILQYPLIILKIVVLLNCMTMRLRRKNDFRFENKGVKNDHC